MDTKSKDDAEDRQHTQPQPSPDNTSLMVSS